MDTLLRDRELRMRGIITGVEVRASAAVADDDLDDASRVLLAVLDYLSGETRDAAFEAKHKRGHGGVFIKMFDRIVAAVKEHHESGGKSDDPLKDFDREQVRKVAKQRGITLKRGASEAEIKQALLDDLKPGGKDADKPDEKTPAKKPTPAKVAPKAEPDKATPSPSWRADLDRERADLEELTKTDPSSVKPLVGGHVAGAELVTYPDGTRTVRKVFSGPQGRLRGHVGEQEDAEELGSLVMAAVGVKAPTVVRTSPTSIEMTHLDGRSGYDLVATGTIDVPPDVLNSDDGRLLGLADTLMALSDRSNPGNWMQMGDGHLAGIDHEFAFHMSQASGNPFAAHFINDRGFRRNDMSHADIATIRERLNDARADFERLGRGDWWRKMMARLDEVDAKAHGRRDRLDVASPDVEEKPAPPKATPSKPEPLSDDPAVREIQVDNRIREAYRNLRRDGGPASLADVRDRLDGIPRAEQDAALKRLITKPGVLIIPESNQSALTQRHRDASVRIGGQDKHHISIADLGPDDLLDSDIEDGEIVIDRDSLQRVEGAKTIADLRAIAADRHLKIPARVKLKKDIRDWLRDELRLKPGEDPAEYFARTGGRPGGLGKPNGPVEGKAALDAVPVHLSTRALGGLTEDVRGLDGLTPRQREMVTSSIDAYRGLGYKGINAYLRSGEPSRGAKSAVAGIDRAMDASALTEPIVVYRGVRSGESTFGPRADWPDDLTGAEWTDLGYPSTTASREIATTGGRVTMRIVVPDGAKAIKLSDFEQEVLLERGLTFRVVRDNGPDEFVDGFGNTHQVDRLLDVEVVPSDTPATPKPRKRAPAKKAAPKTITPALGAPGAPWSEPRTGDAALSAPPMDLSAMADDPRADALWYRSGDNSLETETGRPGAFDMADQMRSRKLDPAMRARVAAIDSVMADSRLPGPIVVYRGIEPDAIFRNPENLVGRGFTDRAFVSTSTDAEHSSWFGGTVMRIHVPAGVKAVRMADRRGVELDSAEREILLDRGLRFRITAQYGRGELKGPWGGAHVVDVEVEP